jgi:beta-phosphoglucomutase
METGIKAFVFDLDGVLANTAEYHYRAWKRLADEEGIPFSREDNEALRGVSRRDSLLLLLHGRQLPEAEMEELMERKNTYYLAALDGLSPRDLLPGAESFLSGLRAEGVKIGLASSSRNARRVVALLGLEPLLDAIVDGNEVAQAKPAPDLFLRAAELLSVPPAECVVVEDAAAGVEAAHRGGFLAVGIGESERLKGADLVLPDLAAATPREVIGRLAKLSHLDYS